MKEDGEEFYVIVGKLFVNVDERDENIVLIISKSVVSLVDRVYKLDINGKVFVNVVFKVVFCSF